jgi:hypothetical protein
MNTNGYVSTGRGFAINGEIEGEPIGDFISGAGDINGDGVNDVLIGEISHSSQVGAVYVIFGKTTAFAETINVSDLDGTNGFVITGASQRDLLGSSVSNAGDVNGDGLDDIVIGAQFAGPGSANGPGAAYIVFGRTTSFGTGLNVGTLTGQTGLIINGTGLQDQDQLGHAVGGGGDINGDGFDDVIIGARKVDKPNSGFDARQGAAYVVFGNSASSGSLDVVNLDGSNGFAVYGASSNEEVGSEASLVSDFNGDGLDDIFAGTRFGLEGAPLVYGISTKEGPTTVFSSLLPAARSGFVGGAPITVFASAINAGANRADSCNFSISGSAPVEFNAQPTNAKNVGIGPIDLDFSMNPGEIKSFILSFRPLAPSTGLDIFPQVICNNASVALIPGVNSVFLSLDSVAVPDILSIAATPDANGVITVPAGSASFMSVSATNIGVGDVGGSQDAAVTVSVDDGGAGLSLLYQICETDALGTCNNPPASNDINTTIGAGPSFFGVFVFDQSSGGVALDPATKRVFLRFTDAGGTVRSVTSAAVTVQ